MRNLEVGHPTNGKMGVSMVTWTSSFPKQPITCIHAPPAAWTKPDIVSLVNVAGGTCVQVMGCLGKLEVRVTTDTPILPLVGRPTARFCMLLSFGVTGDMRLNEGVPGPSLGQMLGPCITTGYGTCRCVH